jgi:hypothetical protein
MKVADEEITCLKNSMRHARLIDSEITVCIWLKDIKFDILQALSVS